MLWTYWVREVEGEMLKSGSGPAVFDQSFKCKLILCVAYAEETLYVLWNIDLMKLRIFHKHLARPVYL